MSRKCNTSERDEASAIVKVHIRNALMRWKANNMFRQCKTSSECEEPKRLQLQPPCSRNRSSGVRSRVVNSVVVAHVEEVFLERPVVFHILCEMEAEQTGQ